MIQNQAIAIGTWATAGSPALAQGIAAITWSVQWFPCLDCDMVRINVVPTACSPIVQLGWSSTGTGSDKTLERVMSVGANAGGEARYGLDVLAFGPLAPNTVGGYPIDRPVGSRFFRVGMYLDAVPVGGMSVVVTAELQRGGQLQGGGGN